MTVGELIVELGKWDPLSKVLIYSVDDADWYDLNRIVSVEDRSKHQAVTFE